MDELRNNQIAKTEQALNRLFEKISNIEPTAHDDRTAIFIRRYKPDLL